MTIPPRSRARYEGMFLVQWIDESGHTTIGFATEADLAATSSKNCGPCCHREDLGKSYLVLGRMKGGRLVDDEGRDDPIEEWLGGEWRD